MPVMYAENASADRQANYNSMRQRVNLISRAGQFCSHFKEEALIDRRRSAVEETLQNR